MRLSLMTWVYNRAHLLEHSTRSIFEQDIFKEQDIQVELNIGEDYESTDHIDDVLTMCNEEFGWQVNRYNLLSFKDYFKPKFNCPAAFYNALVSLCSEDHIIKFDPEFVFLTTGFISKALSLIKKHKHCIVMPLPYHTYEFNLVSLDNIRKEFKKYVYPTHINEQSVAHSNVYYGCMFRRLDYMDLGGIDVRFNDGIGSEDDHLMDQWRRKYGSVNVQSVVEEKGVHLWHGLRGKELPPEDLPFVYKNVQLRQKLKREFPNGGLFTTVLYPEIEKYRWEKGQRIFEGLVSVKT